MTFKPLPRVFLAILAMAMGFSLLAQEKKEEGRFLSDKAGEEIGKIRPLLEGATKNFAEALRRIDAFLPQTADPSYDRAIMFQIQAQVLLQMERTRDAIRPLEQAIRQNRHDPRALQEFRYLLAQLYAVAEDYNRSLDWMGQWMANGAKPNLDQSLFHANLLYQLKRYDEALKKVRDTLTLAPRVKENQLMLELACLLSLQRYKEAVNPLEQLVQLKPDSQSYWSQLMQVYLQTENPLAAIVTIERGMQRGLFKKESDYYALVALHYNQEQYAITAELVEKGFKSGSLPQSQENWELLSYCWQAMNDFERAAEVLSRASKSLPSGDIDNMLAQYYYAAGKPAKALEAVRKAVDKGGFKKAKESKVVLLWLQLALDQRDRTQAKDAWARYLKTNPPAKEKQDLEYAYNELMGPA